MAERKGSSCETLQYGTGLLGHNAQIAQMENVPGRMNLDDLIRVLRMH